MKVNTLASSRQRKRGANADNQSNNLDDTPNNYQTDGEAKANILTFDGNDVGTGSCFEIPGDEDADIILAAQSSIPGGVGGDAVEAGDVDVE